MQDIIGDGADCALRRIFENSSDLGFESCLSHGPENGVSAFAIWLGLNQSVAEKIVGLLLLHLFYNVLRGFHDVHARPPFFQVIVPRLRKVV